MEAYQIAASCREYLDSVGYADTKILLLNFEESDITKNLGRGVEKVVVDKMREMRISVQTGAKLQEFVGDSAIEKIIFRKRGE
jgi:hypothetical protein